jgi:hypothetical protein
MTIQYKTLSTLNAFLLIEKFQNNEKYEIEKYEVIKGEGNLYDDEEFIQLRKKIYDEIAKKSKTPSENERQLVEFSGSKWLHEILHFDKKVFSDHEFWLWLTVKYFCEFVEWRAGSKESPAKLANYGLNGMNSANLTENLLYRMWVRAKIGHDESLQDPYKRVVVIGKYDFWQSFIIRRDFANIKNLSKAFIASLFDSNLKTDEYREIGKWLTAIQSNLLLNSLSYKEAEKLINNKIEEIRK